MALLKYVPVFMCFSMFKILAISYICFFFNGAGLFFLAGSVGVFGLLRYISSSKRYIGRLSILYWLELEEDDEEEANRLYKESVLLGWISMTNLGVKPSEASALNRTSTAYLWLIYYTSCLTSIMVMYHLYPDFSFGILGLFSTDWSQLPLLNTNTVNIQYLLGGTIALGWSSLLVDLLVAGIKWKCCGRHEIHSQVSKHETESSFWDETVLLQGHKHPKIRIVFPFIIVMVLISMTVCNAIFYLPNIL